MALVTVSCAVAVYLGGIAPSLFTRDKLMANEWRLVSFYEVDRPTAHLPDEMRYCDLRFAPTSYQVESHCGRRFATRYTVEGDRLLTDGFRESSSFGWAAAVSYSCSSIAEDCLGMLSSEMRFELGSRYLKIYHAGGKRFALFERGERRMSVLTLDYLLAILLDGFGIDIMRSYTR